VSEVVGVVVELVFFWEGLPLIIFGINHFLKDSLAGPQLVVPVDQILVVLPPVNQSP
jgi:hypothetical protein